MFPFQQIISFDASFINHWNIILPDFSFVTSNTMLNIQSNKSFVESPLFPTFRDLSFHIHRTKIDQTILKPTQLSSDLTISYSITNLEKYQNQGCFYIAYDEFEKGFQYIKNVSVKGKNV